MVYVPWCVEMNAAPLVVRIPLGTPVVGEVVVTITAPRVLLIVTDSWSFRKVQ